MNLKKIKDEFDWAKAVADIASRRGMESSEIDNGVKVTFGETEWNLNNRKKADDFLEELMNNKKKYPLVD